MKKKMKIFLIVLGAILAVIAAVVIIIAVLAGKNVKQMNACVDDVIAKISESHEMTETDAGEYAEMSAYGILHFHVKQYDIKDLGNLSVMTVNAGVMQMATIVFSPYAKDLPLLSCDYMYMLGTRKAYVEFYDLVEEKTDTYMSYMDRYEALRGKYELTDTEASPGWYDYLITVAIYKSAGTKDDEAIRSLLVDAVTIYLEEADAFELLPTEGRAAKIDRTKTYSDRLIDEGGVSTSFFSQALGEDVTRDFFDKVFFGTERYR